VTVGIRDWCCVSRRWSARDLNVYCITKDLINTPNIHSFAIGF
jgi:hypothetical protein